MLNRPTLILNRHWQPVNVACVARALVLVCRGITRVVNRQDYQLYTWENSTQLVPDQDEPRVRSLRLHVRVPEVVALAHYDRAPAQAKLRKQPIRPTWKPLMRTLRCGSKGGRRFSAKRAGT